MCAVMCFCNIAQHDIPFVRLCSCWSRSCCYCNGKIAPNTCTFSMHASLKENCVMKSKHLPWKTSWPTVKIERPICIYVMFAYERLTVDSGEKHFAAVKMKRVCLPPSVEGARMSQSLSWKLRRKALRLLQRSVTKSEHWHCLKNRRCFLIRNYALETHFFINLLLHF